MAEPSALREEYVKRVKRELAALGYVVLKEASYLKAQERQRVARVMEEHATEDAEHARQWARDCLNDERYLRDRLTFVYGIARAHGATVEELGGCADHPFCFCGRPGDRSRVHRAQACEPWVSRDPSQGVASYGSVTGTDESAPSAQSSALDAKGDSRLDDREPS